METFLWAVFSITVLGMLTLDLGIFHRRDHVIGLREAVAWSAFWIALALAFNVLVWILMGPGPALKFLTAYIVEKSLSVDNLFVFILIFSYFGVPPAYEHKVLFWGILGALVMRAVFITAGIALLHHFHWVIYVFGMLLLLSALKIAFSKKSEFNPEKNLLLKLFRRFFPVSGGYESGRFFARGGRGVSATPLFVTLIVVESTDVMFAVDSVPAVLAITSDLFIAFTSNVFAILGLRALYFALSGVMKLFHYLQAGLTVILAYIGIKMLISDFLLIPTAVSLAVLVSVLTVSIAASLIFPKATAE